MPRGRKATKSKKTVLNTKYDANNIVLDKTYGAWADLRRELSDSKSDLADRNELLDQFAACEDSQRAFLILDDYFERLSLSRRDFVGPDWWARMLETTGKERLEETALLFLRAKRPLPTELMAHANFDRLAEVEEAEKDHELIMHLEKWMLPPKVEHLDAPRASVRALFVLVPVLEGSPVARLEMRLTLSRPRSGERFRNLGEIKDLTTRSSHERELFSSEDWEFVEWINATYAEADDAQECLVLKGAELLRWLAKWGKEGRMELDGNRGVLNFTGQVADLRPSLEKDGEDLGLLPTLLLPNDRKLGFNQAYYIVGDPMLAVFENEFYLVRHAPHEILLERWGQQVAIPV
ncbi:MAG: ATP-dependent helicase, partial [Verrucomicrobia bacterium]|nr:ATP-dependent helicase [Verrucomicrobiota bacterium]